MLELYPSFFSYNVRAVFFTGKMESEIWKSCDFDFRINYKYTRPLNRVQDCYQRAKETSTFL